MFLLLPEKFLQFAWLGTEVFYPNLKYLHVKITNSMHGKRNNVVAQVKKNCRKDFQIFKIKRLKNSKSIQTLSSENQNTKYRYVDQPS